MKVFNSDRQSNMTYVRVYGYGEYKYIKVVTMSSVKSSGLVRPKEISRSIDYDGVPEEWLDKQLYAKLEASVSRSRSKVYELAVCNPWEYFFTGTLDSNKYDRSDLAKFHKDFTQWIRDLNKQFNCKIKFLVVPERHADMESWHIHGLLHGLPSELLQQFRIGDVMGKYIADKVAKGDVVYHIPKYDKKFGFCDVEPIKSHERVSVYITKYITKDTARMVSEFNAHTYYHSRGLNTSVLVNKGFLAFVPFEPLNHYEADYCAIETYEYNETYLNYFKSALDVNDTPAVSVSTHGKTVYVFSDRKEVMS